MGQLKISISAFAYGEKIPEKYSCKGLDISPSIKISGIPVGTESLVLIVEDPDAPVGLWIHWLLWNIPLTGEIAEGTVPEGAVQGLNSWGRNDYGGPCPPSGTHRYFFRLYALDVSLHLEAASSKAEVEEVMEGHVLGQAEWMGLFSKE